jgi:signal transduction histidine kinase
MYTLTLRIYLTVVAVLLAFALGSGWIFKRQFDGERARTQAFAAERMTAWGDLLEHALPNAQATPDAQAQALLEWSARLRLPMALDSAQGERLATDPVFQKRFAKHPEMASAIHLDDGRTLWVMRLERLANLRFAPPQPGDPHPSAARWPQWTQRLLEPNMGLVALLLLLFVAVAAGAWPVVRQLTRRLNALKAGVEKFGSGQLSHRVEVSGRDEVAAVATSFNQTAQRIEALVQSHQSLLANASHELRSPLARLKMAVSMLDAAPSSELREPLANEIHTNVAELDALVEEVLLASRLDAAPDVLRTESLDLLALAAEEGARVNAVVSGENVLVQADERLLRRALRNLLENAKRYGAGEISVSVRAQNKQAFIQVADRGAGVPEALRTRIFEPFYRLPGHAEQAGGVGLGLSLVQQIAHRHGGRVQCLGRQGGGTCFELSLPQ